MKVCEREGCEVEFPLAADYPNKRFCSTSCHMKHKNQDSAAQREKGIKGGLVRGQQMIEESTGVAYRKHRSGEHLHRVVAMETLARPLLPGEVVHHEDENILNNEWWNLIVFPSQGDHARHHMLKHCGSPCDCPGIRLKEVVPYVES